jgi:hypothetical protein
MPGRLVAARPWRARLLTAPCAAALGQTHTAATAGVTVLMTGWPLAVGLAAQVLWDARDRAAGPDPPSPGRTVMTWTTWVSGWPAPAGRSSIRLGDATYDQGPWTGRRALPPGRLVEPGAG